MYHSDVIPSDEAGSLAGLLRCRVARSPGAPAYRQHNPSTGSWDSFTWARVGQLVARWRAALAGAGLDPGERVAAMLRNSVEWVLFEQAAVSLGLVLVPLYTQDNPENAAFVLGDSGSRLLLVGGNGHWAALAPHRELFPALETVVALDDAPEVESGLQGHRVADWLPATGGGESAPEVAPDALASIVYTSGTTGRPKGVMLTHRNILSNAEGIAATIPAYREDVFLSFLPLSHMLERTAGYCYPMMAGSEVVFARSVNALAEDLQTIRPSVLISVPRMFERAYMRIERQLEQKGPLARRLFSLAEDIGWRRFQWLQGQGRAPGPVQRMLWPVLRALVVKKILAGLGGRLRVTVSGGGRLDDRIAHRFLGFGLPVVQGYGLTEASPVVASNRIEDNVPDSVGSPLPGVEVRVAEGGELLVRGAGVMVGYWRRPEATAKTIDADGWLHTGDIAQIIDGRVFIRGRIKEILVTSTGEKVSPVDLEAAIIRDRLFEQVMIVGESRPYLAALLVLRADSWEHFAAELGTDAHDPASLLSPMVGKAVLQRINRLLLAFPAYARIRAVHLTLEPWSIADGLMTPTQKLKRARVMERFADVIQTLYAGHDVPASKQ